MSRTKSKQYLSNLFALRCIPYKIKLAEFRKTYVSVVISHPHNDIFVLEAYLAIVVKVLQQRPRFLLAHEGQSASVQSRVKHGHGVDPKS